MSVPQSLPSFAQAFSSSSLSETSPISNALPPIQSRPTHSPPATTTKKRSREDPPPPPPLAPRPIEPHSTDTTRPSPVAVRIKEEDRDDSQRPPQSPPQQSEPSRDSSATPGVQPLSKKRRVTVSGTPHGSSAEQGTPIPISPVVSTFSLPDDAVPRDQPRPILVKQQPKPLADQRRGSVILVSGTILSRSPPGDQLTTPKLTRIGRASPSAISVVNRCAGNPTVSSTQVAAASARPLSPPPMIAQQPPSLTSTQNAVDPKQQPTVAHSLPPPPISFARRRAAQSGGRKKKPADILISPRGAGPSDPLAPVIQSAPPVADPGRFPMAIPRLPLALNNAQTIRRVAGNVPPTPTRFSLQATAAPLISSTARTIQSSPHPVPIVNTLVPPTPHALHHPGYTGDKSAFLAPFEVFYDALNDSKQLKSWLSDQLQKSSALMMSLKQQQDKMDEIVEDLVEKRTRVMREEMTMLRQRMESLEEALLAVRAESSTRGQDSSGHGYPQAKPHPNGVPPGTESPSSYRFPGSGQRGPGAIVGTSPGREPEHQSSLSPPMEVARRLSVSAAGTRPEPPQGLHASFTLGGDSRRPSGSQGAAKTTGPVRPLAERPSTVRPTDSRAASRLYYSGTYGNGSPMSVDGQASSRDGSKS